MSNSSETENFRRCSFWKCNNVLGLCGIPSLSLQQVWYFRLTVVNQAPSCIIQWIQNSHVVTESYKDKRAVLKPVSVHCCCGKWRLERETRLMFSSWLMLVMVQNTWHILLGICQTSFTQTAIINHCDEYEKRKRSDRTILFTSWLIERCQAELWLLKHRHGQQMSAAGGSGLLAQIQHLLSMH